MGLLRLITAAVCAAPFLPAQTPVATYHNDNARTGQSLTETLLTPASVRAGSFGKRFASSVDGTVYAQPLYLPRIQIAGKGLRDLVLVATAHDSVYAFDADTATGSHSDPLWKVSFLDSAAGITTVPEADVDCPVISPELGIVGTPVIDPSAGTLFVIAETKEPGPTYVYRLHALNVADGTERSGSPVVIQAPDFVALTHKQRGAMLFSNGTVYSEWSSHCDNGEYHGFILAHNAATLQMTAVFNTTPQGNGASFWNSGAGPAADSDGNLFVVSANGDFNAGSGGLNYGDSVIELNGPGLTVSDFFTPFNQAYLDDLDLDVGSSGAVLLPDSAGSTTHPHVLVTAGKEGRLYLLDRDNLGRTQVSEDTSALASLTAFSNAALGSMAWFNGSVYVAPQNEPLSTFTVSGAVMGISPTAQSSKLAGSLGATPSISANGTANGIAWMVTSEDALSAFDATTLEQLYDSNGQAVDSLGSYVEFAVPTVANGQVYVGGTIVVTSYGLLPSATASIGAVTNAASYSTTAVAPGSLVTLFGSNLSLGAAASAVSVPLPISLGDVLVTFNGVAAPLLYVSPTQINAQVPSSTAVGVAQVTVQVSGSPSASFGVPIQASAPGLFVVNGGAAEVNQDGSVNSASKPAASGSIVSLYLTGSAALDSLNVDGDPASGQPSGSATPQVTVTVGGLTAAVSYAGPAPGFTGLIQINAQIPSFPAGSYPVIVAIDGVASNSAPVFVSGS